MITYAEEATEALVLAKRFANEEKLQALSARPAFMLVRVICITDSHAQVADLARGGTRYMRATSVVLRALHESGSGVFQVTVQDDRITAVAGR